MTGNEPFERRVGTRLQNKWTLVRLLGVGGMAAVYEGVHTIGRRVAIKILHPEVAADAGVRARFEQEARTANAFHHPGAVEIVDFDLTDDGQPFLVMELLEGHSLQDLLDQGHVPSFDRLMQLTDELLDVLAAAHAHGIIHRDIKPDNLFVLASGALKVLDFGIARVRTDGPASRKPTQTGTTIGTVVFMPPEQVVGSSDLDARADIFAVGATMFRVLTGRYVHDAEGQFQRMVQAASSAAPPLASVLPSVPAEVALVVDRALAFERDNRYPDARTMQDDVRALLRRQAPPYASLLARSGAPAPYKPTQAFAQLPADTPPLSVAMFPAPGVHREPTSLGASRDPGPPGATHDPGAHGAFRDPAASLAHREPPASVAYRDPVASIAHRDPAAPGSLREPGLSGVYHDPLSLPHAPTAPGSAAAAAAFVAAPTSIAAPGSLGAPGSVAAPGLGPGPVPLPASIAGPASVHARPTVAAPAPALAPAHAGGTRLAEPAPALTSPSLVPAGLASGSSDEPPAAAPPESEPPAGAPAAASRRPPALLLAMGALLLALLAGGAWMSSSRSETAGRPDPVPSPSGGDGDDSDPPGASASAAAPATTSAPGATTAVPAATPATTTKSPGITIPPIPALTSVLPGVSPAQNKPPAKTKGKPPKKK